MPSTPTTKSQVQAYKFVMRRMQSALVRRDSVMLHDPMRTHSRATVVGVILGVLGAVVFVLWALLSPAPTVPGSGIVIGEQSGTVYVVTGDPKKLIPTFNLASARLIILAQQKQGQQGGGAAATPAPSKAPDPPTVVSDEELKNIPREKLTGIPDGPQLLPDQSQRISPNWAVCDQVVLDPQLPQPDSVNRTDTTVIGGIANVGTELTGQQALLGDAGNGKTYLIYRLPPTQARPNANTVRAQVSLDNNDPVKSALQLPSKARKVSQAFLNAIPEVGRLVPPPVDAAGQQPTQNFQGLVVGDVFSTTPAGGQPDFWLITRTGIQKVSPAVADIIRVAKNGSSSRILDLGLNVLNGTKQLQPGDDGYVKVDDYPQSRPTVLDATQGSPVACLGWSYDQSKNKAHTSVYVSNKLPAEALNADGTSKVQSVSTTGPNGLPITGFFMPPGFGAVVSSATESSATFGKGPIQLISDRGLRYGIPDENTAKALGLDGAQPAPESIIGLLPTGASLNTQNVLKQFDSVPIDPNAGSFPAQQAGQKAGG